MSEARSFAQLAPQAAEPADGCTCDVEEAASGRLRGLRGLALGLVLGAIVATAWRACGRTHARRRAHRSVAAPAPVQSWENEGGTPDAATG